MTPQALHHLWAQEASLVSPIVGMWMRGICVSSMCYEDGRLAIVHTKSLPQFNEQFKLMGYGRGVMMDCLERLCPGATWIHDQTKDEVAS